MPKVKRDMMMSGARIHKTNATGPNATTTSREKSPITITNVLKTNPTTRIKVLATNVSKKVSAFNPFLYSSSSRPKGTNQVRIRRPKEKKWRTNTIKLCQLRNRSWKPSV